MHEQYGQKLHYDPSWKGPLHRRKCTDCFWLVIFVAFLGCWTFVAYYAAKNGNIHNLVAPTDSEGRKCGVDPDVSNRTKLVFFDLSKCAKIQTDGHCPTTQVCVNRCPKESFLFDQEKVIQPIEQLKAKMICKVEVDLTQFKTVDQLQMLVDNEKCARWYLPSKDIIRRCVPKSAGNFSGNAGISGEDLESASKFIQRVAEIEETIKKIFEDMKATTKFVISVTVASGVATLVYIVLLRWIARPMVYATIGIVCGLLAYATYAFTMLYKQSGEKGHLYMLIGCAALLVVIILFVLFLRKRIRLACQIIKEASKAVTSILSSLVFPILPWVLSIAVIIFAVGVASLLVTVHQPAYRVDWQRDNCVCKSSSNYKPNSTCEPNAFNKDCHLPDGTACPLSSCAMTTETPKLVMYFHAVNFVGFWWLFFFVSAFGDMVLAATFATWYWTYEKSDIPFFTVTAGMYRTIRYHLGTLAFGALILTICQIIRIIIEFIYHKVKEAENQVATAIACFCSCLFSLLEKFLKFLNSNAYIMCAVHGKGFCRSARDAFNLLMRNVVRVYVINKLTGWLLEIGKLLIVGLTVGFTWWWFTHKTKETLNYWYVPAVITGITSYLIATVFFKVLAAAIDTLFLCFLEDCERNDGSSERPYFMSRKLKKLLHK